MAKFYESKNLRTITKTVNHFKIHNNEPRHEKTNVLHMQKQRGRSASR